MQRKHFFRVFVSTLLILFSALVYAELLTIVIKNIKHDTGKIYVSLHQGKEGYDNRINFRQEIVDANSPTLRLSFDVPEGEYAIRLYHDVDDNGELNINVLGIPREPYAFSNNAKPRMSAPGWNPTKFTVGKQPVVQEIELIAL